MKTHQLFFILLMMLCSTLTQAQTASLFATSTVEDLVDAVLAHPEIISTNESKKECATKMLFFRNELDVCIRERILKSDSRFLKIALRHCVLLMTEENSSFELKLESERYKLEIERYAQVIIKESIFLSPIARRKAPSSPDTDATSSSRSVSLSPLELAAVAVIAEPWAPKDGAFKPYQRSDSTAD